MASGSVIVSKLREKVKHKKNLVFLVFIDIEKTNDRVNREAM